MASSTKEIKHVLVQCTRTSDGPQNCQRILTWWQDEKCPDKLPAIEICVNVDPASRTISLDDWHNRLPRSDRQFTRFGTYFLRLVLDLCRQKWNIPIETKGESKAPLGIWKVTAHAHGVVKGKPMTDLVSLYQSLGFEVTAPFSELNGTPIEAPFGVVLEKATDVAKLTSLFTRFGLSAPTR